MHYGYFTRGDGFCYSFNTGWRIPMKSGNLLETRISPIVSVTILVTLGLYLVVAMGVLPTLLGLFSSLFAVSFVRLTR